MNKNKNRILFKEAKEILDLVGTSDNFTEFYNCITRLRFKIINKDKVNYDLLTKLHSVKGVNWMGDELQVIIGSTVSKFKHEIDKYINSKANISKVKIPFYRKFVNFIVSVVVPCLPLMIYTGFASGISALFSSKGIEITQSGWGKNLSDLDVLSAFLFLNERVGFMLLGVFFGYGTAKYINGDLILNLLICLTLSSGLLMNQQWVIISNIFNTGQNISIKGYDGSILIFLIAVVGFNYLHKWVRTWMPSAISTMFTPLVSVGVTLSLSFFLLGPIISLIETLLATGVLYLLDIPFGIGALILGLLFQPLVLTGSHLALSSLVLSSMINLNQSSVYWICVQISAFAQAGSVLGCALRAKEKNFKMSAYATFPITAIFGITEPAMYAINVPKGKPFLAGCLSSGIFGLTAGLMGLQMKIMAGNGIFSFLGLVDIKDAFYFFGLAFLSIVLAFALTFIFYNERENEFKSYSSVIKKIKKILNLKREDEIELQEGLEKIKQFSENNKLIEKNIIKLQKQELILQGLKKRNKDYMEEKTSFENLLDELKKEVENYYLTLETILSKIKNYFETNDQKIGKKSETLMLKTINSIQSLGFNYNEFLNKHIKRI